MQTPRIGRTGKERVFARLHLVLQKFGLPAAKRCHCDGVPKLFVMVAHISWQVNMLVAA